MAQAIYTYMYRVDTFPCEQFECLPTPIPCDPRLPPHPLVPRAGSRGPMQVLGSATSCWGLVFVNVQGDLEFQWQAYDLKNYYRCNWLCPNCSASKVDPDLLWTDFTPAAMWRFWATSICAVMRFWANSWTCSGSGPELVHMHIILHLRSSAEEQ
jgi:hypothetical protein